MIRVNAIICMIWAGIYSSLKVIKAAPGYQKSSPSYMFNSFNFDSEKISETTLWDHLKVSDLNVRPECSGLIISGQLPPPWMEFLKHISRFIASWTWPFKNARLIQHFHPLRPPTGVPHDIPTPSYKSSFLSAPVDISILKVYTVLVKSFAHLNGNFFLAFLEEIRVSPPLSGGSQKIHSIKCIKLISTVKSTIIIPSIWKLGSMS